MWKRVAILLLYLPLGALVFFFYRELVGAHATLFLILLLLSYSCCMGVNYYAMHKLLRCEREDKLTFAKVFRLSFLIGLPIYWAWTLVSLLPITAYEVWFITGFPITAISVLALKPVAEYWTKNNRFIFWTINVVIYIGLLMLGQMMMSLLFQL